MPAVKKQVFLPLKFEWFTAIDQGIKRTDFRANNEYWEKRLDGASEALLVNSNIKDPFAPTMVAKILGIELIDVAAIPNGLAPPTGSEEHERMFKDLAKVFAIHLGEVTSRRNMPVPASVLAKKPAGCLLRKPACRTAMARAPPTSPPQTKAKTKTKGKAKAKAKVNARDIIAQLEGQGLTFKEMRKQAKAKGVSASRLSQLRPRQLPKSKDFIAEQRGLGVPEAELKGLMIEKGYGRSTVKACVKPAAKPVAQVVSPIMLRYAAYQADMRQEQGQ